MSKVPMSDASLCGKERERRRRRSGEKEEKVQNGDRWTYFIDVKRDGANVGA